MLFENMPLLISSLYSMTFSEIHFHDTRILRVIEDTAMDTLTMEVEYPADWENNRFVPGTLLFTNAHNYQVFEGPFEGVPTILDADIINTSARWSRLRLQTNAGYREVSYVAVNLVLENATSGPRASLT